MSDTFQKDATAKPKSSGSWFGFVLIAVLVVFIGYRALQLRPATTHAVMLNAELTLDEALDESEATGKPVLAFATASWCGPCQSLKRNGLADESVLALISERTIPVTLEETTDRGARDIGKLPVRAYPTLALIQGGEVLSMIEGAQPASAIITWLESNTEPAPASEG